MSTVEKRFIVSFLRVWYVDLESPILQSIKVVNEFPDVFPNDLPGIPPEREINFSIDTLPDIQPISIPQYGMAS
ncbi:hypothetical protein MTR67_038562 [Solanum verrucosum]|uniref:Cellular nucleic acid-binding protein n=1 Tax=Solanum verrucosum TaxID=315347 RepID=A0AAF0UFR0_SOLVR|nr:hypothetical protein MTR67_038562 [Solanum verrucosum]